MDYPKDGRRTTRGQNTQTACWEALFISKKQSASRLTDTGWAAGNDGPDIPKTALPKQLFQTLRFQQPNAQRLKILR
jgi:hypothetical protein